VSILSRRFAGGLSAAFAILLAPCARADVSSWLFFGMGPSAFDRSSYGQHLATSMQIDTGIGLPASYAVVPGLLLRMNTRFGDGSDLALLVRTATGGYARGNWGVAVDLGGYERWWGNEPSPGFAGTLSLGAPWGITLNANFQQGSNDVRTFSAVLGLDLARFTVYRSSGLTWWSNPYPSPPTRERRSASAD
jgi:hypothetical protein